MIVCLSGMLNNIGPVGSKENIGQFSDWRSEVMVPTRRIELLTSILPIWRSPAELRRHLVVGVGRFELPTSRLSAVRSNQLSYTPLCQETRVKSVSGKWEYFLHAQNAWEKYSKNGADGVDSNPRPPDYKSDALPTELRRRVIRTGHGLPVRMRGGAWLFYPFSRTPDQRGGMKTLPFAVAPGQGCSSCPLGLPENSGRSWWSQGGSNSRPLACHASALPAELWPRKFWWVVMDLNH